MIFNTDEAVTLFLNYYRSVPSLESRLNL